MSTAVQHQPGWLTALRAAGQARFGETGLPTQRQEVWKYTGLNKLKALTFEPSKAVAGTAPKIEAMLADAKHRLVFVNGRFDANQSRIGALPQNALLASLADVLANHPNLLEGRLGISAAIDRRPMAALNTAWIEDGLVLVVPRGAAIEGTIEVVFVSDGDAPVAHPRLLVALGDLAEAVLVERHLGSEGGGFTNQVAEVALGNGASFRHYIMHSEPEASTALETVTVTVGRDAAYRSFALTAGGGLVRREVEVALRQPGGTAQVDGAYLVDGDRHADTTILIDHQADHCSSRQTQKGVIDDDGRAVYQGKILVRPQAQKTDGYQLSQTLLLSPKAEVDVKPELEIHADDVKCSHGATVGRLDADALFFLRARGIPEAEARALLIQGFIGGALDEIDREDVGEAFGERGIGLAEQAVFRGAFGEQVMTLATVDPIHRARRTNGYDVERVRADFPILSRLVHGKPLVYLDSAASAQKPRAVIDAMTKFYEEDYANIHRGVHFLSQRSTDAFEAARAKVARFLNAAKADEIVFTRNATESINLVAQSWGRKNLGPGDEIVLTELEHHANIVPWQMLRAEKGFEIKVAPIDDTGQIRLEEMAKLIGPKTKLVAVSHMSNALGTILPVREIVRMAHAQGALVLVDGCQAAVHKQVDVQALDADFYAFSGHKLYGPTGIGVLYGKYALLEAMPPYQGGGDMIDRVTFARTTFKEPPHRFEAGTPAITEAIGLAAAIDYLADLGPSFVADHEDDVLTYATERLSQIDGLTIHGTAAEKGAILSFTMAGAHAHDIATILDQQGVAVRAGHHCAHPLMDRLGVTATARASFALYSTRAEADALADAVGQVKRIFKL